MFAIQMFAIHIPTALSYYPNLSSFIRAQGTKREKLWSRARFLSTKTAELGTQKVLLIQPQISVILDIGLLDT